VFTLFSREQPRYLQASVVDLLNNLLVFLVHLCFTMAFGEVPTPTYLLFELVFLLLLHDRHDGAIVALWRIESDYGVLEIDIKVTISDVKPIAVTFDELHEDGDFRRIIHWLLGHVGFLFLY
jgi:hypothetical protein